MVRSRHAGEAACSILYARSSVLLWITLKRLRFSKSTEKPPAFWRCVCPRRTLGRLSGGRGAILLHCAPCYMRWAPRNGNTSCLKFWKIAPRPRDTKPLWSAFESQKALPGTGLSCQRRGAGFFLESGDRLAESGLLL